MGALGKDFLSRIPVNNLVKMFDQFPCLWSWKYEKFNGTVLENSEALAGPQKNDMEDLPKSIQRQVYHLVVFHIKFLP